MTGLKGSPHYAVAYLYPRVVQQVCDARPGVGIPLQAGRKEVLCRFRDARRHCRYGPAQDCLHQQWPYQLDSTSGRHALRTWISPSQWQCCYVS